VATVYTGALERKKSPVLEAPGRVCEVDTGEKCKRTKSKERCESIIADEATVQQTNGPIG
jgi:hypothetical protein